jgi:radical SAM superfamily enzyme YgiQ (UPF0313 family)
MRTNQVLYMKTILRCALSALILLAVLIKTETQTGPAWLLWGNPEHISFDESAQEWFNANTGIENWRRGDIGLTKPERVPVKKTLVALPRLDPMLHLYTRCVAPRDESLGISNRAIPQKQRLVLVNVEQMLNETKEGTAQYRVWPHLGINFVGTAAEEEGCEVQLWDENVAGNVPLEELLRPGDTLGLSLVVTGMERGIELARRAKALGAKHVIAGNDSAIFRANQVMAIADHPIDAVFTSNSVAAVRQFFRQIGGTPIEALSIPGVQVTTGQRARSNERSTLLDELAARRAEPKDDEVLMVPNLALYPHWDRIWKHYRETFGHKHQNPETVRNALALFAQGCTRTRGSKVCQYCTISGVADIRLPKGSYLEKTVEAYDAFGINMVFNVTDSSFEMYPVVKGLQEVGARWPAMIIYGRAQGIAQNPQLIEEWQKVATERLLINVGMDSGSDEILLKGIVKSSVEGCGSRLEENRQAVRHIKAAGAHLHYSLIFGSPGETIETCESSLRFLEWTVAELGGLLDICETDIFWLNFGSPAGQLFHDYGYAVHLASLAGKHITRDDWANEFVRFTQELVVPTHVEESWYRHFTSISLETAQLYNERAAQIMAAHTGSIRGRAFKPTA